MSIKKGMLYFLYNADGGNAAAKKEIELDVIPDSVAHAYNANWESQDILGRMSPVYAYKNGSEETYSFSVVLHEDIMSGKYQGSSLVELIEDIRSLSYPIQATSNANLFMPRVYFQIGEIAGYGIVKTSVEWNKPFRSGHYVYATINFDITIDEKILPIKVQTIQTTNKLPEDFYLVGSQVISAYTRAQTEGIVDSLSGVATFITDLVDPSDADGLNAVRRGWASESFDYSVQRLGNIYNAFTSTDADLSGLSFIKSLTSMDFQQYQSKAVSLSSKDYDRWFDGYIRDFNAFVDYYYKEINPDMTDDERQAVKDEFFLTINSIKELAREVAGYAASS